MGKDRHKRRDRREDVEVKIADAHVANDIANSVVAALDDVLSVSARAPAEQDILFGVAMAFAVLARRSRVVETDARKMIDVCLRAPIHEVPTPAGHA